MATTQAQVTDYIKLAEDYLASFESAEDAYSGVATLTSGTTAQDMFDGSVDIVKSIDGILGFLDGIPGAAGTLEHLSLIASLRTAKEDIDNYGHIQTHNFVDLVGNVAAVTGLLLGGAVGTVAIAGVSIPAATAFAAITATVGVVCGLYSATIGLEQRQQIEAIVQMSTTAVEAYSEYEHFKWANSDLEALKELKEESPLYYPVVELVHLLSPSITVSQAKEIADAAATHSVLGDCAALVNFIRETILGISSVSISTVEEYHLALESTFAAAEDALGSVRIRPFPSSADEIVGLAKSDEAVRRALYLGWPFIYDGPAHGVNVDSNQLTIEDPISGLGNLSEEWLKDRALLARAIVGRNIKESVMGWDDALPGDRTIAFEWVDGNGESQTLIGERSLGARPWQSVQFGTDDSELLEGTDYQIGDHLYGGDGSDELNGYNGDDSLEGGAGDDELYGQNGDDLLVGGRGADQLNGDLGDDRLLGGLGRDAYIFDKFAGIEGGFGEDIIQDLDGAGSITIDEEVLTGGKRKVGSDVHYDEETRTSYKEFGASLHIARDGVDGTVTVQDWSNGELGIRLELDLDELPPPVMSPIILDIDGDGVATIGLDANVHFDHDGNRFSEATGWVGPRDALLVRDLDGNGRIETGRELFGSETILLDGSKAPHGFSALAELDSNRDGKIDYQDAAYSSLMVWTDSNSDGISGEQELVSAATAGIDEISLSYSSVGYIDEHGNSHAQLGSYTANDGGVRSATDVWFVTNPMDTIPAGAPLEVRAEIATLPDLQGFGTVRSLHQSMVTDPVLQSLVEQFTNAETSDARSRLVRDILWRWTGADSHAADSRGMYMSDARWLYMIEAFTGTPYFQEEGTNAGTGNPGPNAAVDLYETAAQHYEVMFARLMAQAHLDDLFEAATVVWKDSQRTFEVDLGGTVELLATLTDEDGLAGREKIAEFTRSLHALGQMSNDVQAQLLAGLSYLGADVASLILTPPPPPYSPQPSDLIWSEALTGDDYRLGTDGSDTILGGAGNDTLYGGGSDDELLGGDGSDNLLGGLGNDRLYGGNGSDRYYFSRGAGQDTVLNQDNDGLGVSGDTIVITAQSTEVVAARLGDDLVIEYVDTSDRLTVVGYFTQGASTGRAVEYITFSDGVVWNIAAVNGLVAVAGDGSNVLLGTQGSDVIHALDGNDTVTAGEGSDQLWGDAGNDVLNGEEGDDTLEGGAGDDALDGGLGSDTYVFGVGSGHDLVREGRDGAADGIDVLRIQRLAPDAVRVSRDRTDIVISLLGQNPAADSIRLQGALEGFGNTANRIEQVVFDDGTVWTFEELLLAVTRGTSDDDRLEGFSWADTLDGGAGNDTLLGLGGSNTLLGGAGNDSLYGGEGDDRLDGGSGTDSLNGGAGTNTFVFGRGDGQDTIAALASGGQAGVGTLLFKVGVAPNDVLIRQAGEGAITVSIAGTLDSVTVSLFYPGYWGSLGAVQQIQFADGTIWDTEAIQARILAGSPTNDTISGTVGADTIAGQSGDDVLYGREGDDSLNGGDGNDTLDGGSGINTLRGGQGADLLRNGALMEGGAGEDIIEVSTGQIVAFGMGHGHDRLRGSGSDDPASTIRFADGVASTDIQISRVHRDVLSGPYDLLLTIKSTGDTILVEGFSPDGAGPDAPSNPLQAIEFSDGTTWNLAEILRRAGIGGAGDDTIVGFLGVETLDGGAGDDVMYGHRSYGNASYESNWETSPDLLLGGTGNDTMHGGEFDVLEGGDGDDRLYAFAGNGELKGGAGNDWLNSDNDSRLEGGQGQDLLLVGLRDTVHFNRGDGHDTLLGNLTTDSAEQAQGGQLVLGAGIDEVDVTASLAGNDGLVLQLGDGDQIDLANYFEAEGEAANVSVTVQTVVFADETSRAVASWIQAGTSASEQVTGSSGNDVVAGYAGNDTISAGSGNDGVQGGFGNDSLSGGAGDDTLAGGAGTDRLIGGTGDDVYYVDGADLAVQEATNEGIDTVHLSTLDMGTYVLAANVENLVLEDALDDYGNRGAWYEVTGNALNNRIVSYESGSRMDGGAGVDTLIGGDGDDTYVVDSTTDTIVENTGEGIDSLESSVTISALTANVEHLTLTGTAAINGAGNALDNVLIGNTAVNILTGGLGNDTYILDTTTDIVVEAAGEGIDTVETSVSQTTLATNVENLVLTSWAGAISAHGNGLNNRLTGNHDANTLNGGDGIDTLDGGLGDDTYVVDSATDAIIEEAGGGVDTLESSVSVAALASNVEHLVLTGVASIDGNGNALDNTLTGNAAANLLAGGAGNDTYVLDGTADTIVEVAGDGVDTVRSSATVASLAANVEDLVLTGTSAIDGTGNALDNVLTGNTAANVLVGGTGNDTYVLDGSADTIVELADEGVDTVESSATVLALGANVERLVLTGTGAINGAGNEQDNELTGNVAANILSGGAGNDIYVLDSSADTVVEQAGEGMDTVQSSATVAALAANVENLILTGTAAINGTANSLDNSLTGNSAANVLAGGAGNDTYVLNSTLDTVVENTGEGTDTIQSSVIVTALAANVENLVLTGSASLSGTGNAQNNVITGNAADNTLDGSTGIDTLIGGAGNDMYVVDSATDTIIEDSGGGSDTVRSSASVLVLATNVENLTLTGSNAISGTGNSLDNVLTGNGSANTLAGQGGVDTLIGGSGDDIYIVDSSADTIIEYSNNGNDTLQSSVTVSMLATEVENLTLTGTEGVDGSGNGLSNLLTGNIAANRLTGGGGNDTLDGGAGDDWLSGGIGDDTYFVDSRWDYVVENAGDGSDTIVSQVTQQALAGNVENLILSGTAAIDGHGNSLNNVLTGNAAANRLDGGDGYDRLVGGGGDDTYVVDTSGDQIVETADGGIDTIEASITFSLTSPLLLANIENLTLTGTSELDATGNALNNELNGNSAANTLNGGAGVDTLAGGAGDDTYLVDSATDTIVEHEGGGIDIVQSSVTNVLASHVENLTLTGSGAINGTGNSLDNLITGNSGANVLTGGLGDDIYVVNSANDSVVENADEGIDTIQSSATLTLAANVENLTLTGSSSINGTGNVLDNVITGNSGSNVMTGGLGNDTYVVGSTGDSVVENADEGMDTVLSSVTLTLAANVEALVLTGTSTINGTGNGLNNEVTGNAAANTLSGGAGVDTLIGGTGNDIYVVDSATDTILELADEGVDTVQSSVTLSALAGNVENLTLTGTSAINGTGNALDNLITGNSAANVMTGGLGNDTYVVGSTTDSVVENAGEGTDTIQSSVTLTALAANVENLTLTGSSALNATGNELNNLLTGNTGANTLNGGTGIDTLAGGAGNDVYVVDTSTDTVIENAGEGTDTLQSSVTVAALTDNVENLTLTGTAAVHGTGNALNNVLTGNSAANTLTGGLGDDTYVVDSTADTVVENAGEGTDTLQSSVTVTALVANVENLTLSGTSAINGTGNALDNVITGNSGANVMTGGLGNDTYVVGSTSDSVVEAANEGLDTIQTTATLASLAANVENLTLLGSSALSGTGNALDNVISGNTGANTLNGGTGIDMLAGGAGNDTYVVDTTTDTLVELAGQGTDTVQSSVSLSLAENLDNLTLTGASAINATGNELANVLTGNSAANVLTGGLGDDTYVLDASADTVIEAAGEGVDTIQSSVTTSLVANVENLTLTGTSAINGTGNDFNNVITGNSGANVMTGGLGDDTYVVGSTTDSVVESAGEGVDTIQSSVTLTLAANVENLTLTGSSAINATGNSLNNVITGNSGANVMTGGLGDDTYVVGSTTDTVQESSGEGTDTVLSSATLTLAANVENLTLTGTSGISATGNALDNTLTGNSGTNVLTGGLGNDVYVVQSSADSVVENASEGVDTIQSTVTLASLAANVENLMLIGSSAINGTGNALDNLLSGNVAANTLNGGAGIDTLAGSLGDDIYVVDSATDSIVELAGEGADTVQSSVTIEALAANVESLLLTGSSVINGAGNDLDNTLTGNTASNVLTGGQGNDTYVLDSSVDTVVETAGAGIDTVRSSVTVASLAANVENITLTGSSGINATGNELDNLITGNSGSNKMTGGLGNDTYVVASTGDSVVELAAEGTDTIQSSVTLASLAANVENLQLVGTSAINGIGNALDNLLSGNEASNTLTGGDGADTLDGAAGADTLVGGTGADTYRLRLGSGVDTVQENDAAANVVDWAEFGAGIGSGDVSVTRVGDDLRVSVNNTEDALVLSNWYLGAQYQVENFRWSDGSVSTAAEIEAMATEGAQGIQGSEGAQAVVVDTEELRFMRWRNHGINVAQFQPLTRQWVRWHDVGFAISRGTDADLADAIGIAPPAGHGMLLVGMEDPAGRSNELTAGRRRWTDPQREERTVGSIL